jgi:type VI secretion system protein ImpL
LAFLKRTFLILVGLLLIAIFIWIAGPYFAFGNYRPLESIRARLIAIGVVVAWWVAYRLVKRLQAFRKSDRLLAAVVAQPQPEKARPSAEAVKLRERFEEAVATLKQQRAGRSLYDLPWYVIIGAPGSGKTTALLNSGLKFPLEQRVGKGALRGVGGTRNCDWWFTDEAVFLDTAGRYTTQDSDAASDSAAWAEFLALLRKYRVRRPVNGVILTINAQDLMVQSESAREAHVEAARRRLDELNRELRIQLPVYLMVTKCDLVAGFAEYFDDLSQDGRAQVWGVTFPFERRDANETTALFPGEFDALITRLNERVFARLEEVRDPRRRTRVFAFPQQMAALRDVLTQFVNEVFASTQFDQQILLRGVYFTSGTQDGTPVDRLLGAIGRRFGVASEAVAPPSGPGKAYFVERLLKDVMIGESGLAGVNRRLEARKAAAQLGSYVAMALIAAIGVTGLSVSYGRNRAYLTQAAADVAAVNQLPAVPPNASPEQLLQRLNAIHAVVDSSDRYRSETSWTMRWGLYQGGSVGNSARDAYVRELDGMLLPRVASRLRARLIEYASDPLRLYFYLKGYLMLGEPRYLDKKHLQALTDLEWKTAQPGAAVGAALSTHFQNLLDLGDTLRPVAIDRSLVAQARSSLRQTSMAQIMYDQIKRDYAGDTARALHLDNRVGVQPERVLRRKSGISLSEPLPALYTKPVFQEIAGEGRTDLLKIFERDRWVLGEDSAADPVKTAAAVTTLYETDYIRAWDALLDDLAFVSFATVSQLNDALRILIGPTSPLRGLATVVRDNTALVEAPKTGAEPKGLVDETKRKLSLGIDSLLKTATGAPAVMPGALITAKFQPIQQLIAGEAGKTPMDDIIRLIGEIQQQIGTLGPDVAGTDPGTLLTNGTMRGLLQSLQERAGALPPGLRTLVAEIGDRTARTIVSEATSDIEQRYQREVLYTCRALIENRYPFPNDTKNPEVTLTDFAKVFGYDGAFDRFFTESLEKQVDTSRRPWTWRPGAVNPSNQMLQTFETAQLVREMFFTKGSPMPAVSFSVTLMNLDPTVTRFILQVDGQYREARQGQAVKTNVEWPGKSGEAVATFESRFIPEQAANFSGPWAWFKLVDRTARTADSQLRVVLDIATKYNKAEVLIEASGARSNPFAARNWRQFSCGS